MGMNIAVIKTGGKQYLVSEGLMLSVEKIAGVKDDGSVTFDEVLFTDDGTTATVGKPTTGKKITATVMTALGKGPKLSIVRYKAKSRYHKRTGHGQPYTKVTIGKV